jgi:hypothetical protein
MHRLTAAELRHDRRRIRVFLLLTTRRTLGNASHPLKLIPHRLLSPLSKLPMNLKDSHPPLMQPPQLLMVIIGEHQAPAVDVCCLKARTDRADAGAKSSRYLLDGQSGSLQLSDMSHLVVVGILPSQKALQLVKDRLFSTKDREW